MKVTGNRERRSVPKVPGFPERVVLELTPLCNLSCPMCPRHYIKPDSGYMREEIWRRLINEIAEVSPRTIILPFWRGESLLHPQFLEFIDYALNKSLRIHLCTNGQIMTSDYAVALSKLEFVTFSIHTQLGYSRAKEFLSIRKDCRPTTQVSFVTGEPSEGILTELVVDPKLGGFDSVRLYREHTKDGAFGKLGQPLKNQRIFCPKLLDSLAIAYDGKVSRCNHIWEAEDLVNADEITIKDVWNSDYLKQIREDYPDAYCESCDQWTGHTCGESWRLVEGKVEHTIFG